MNKNHGVALIQALLLSTVLSIIVMSFARYAQSSNVMAMAVLSRTEAMLQLETVLSRIELMLLTGQQPGNLQGVINRHSQPFFVGPIEVKVQDLAGLVNLPITKSTSFGNLLKHYGLSEREAFALEQAVEDWQDKDNRPGPAGAEQSSYPKAVTVRNAPVQTLAELAFIKGMTPQLYQQLLPNLSLYPSSHFNPLTASPAILQTLINNPAVVNKVLAQRMSQQLSEQELFRLTGLEIGDTIAPVYGDASRLSLTYRAANVQLVIEKELVVKPYEPAPLRLWSIKRN